MVSAVQEFLIVTADEMDNKHPILLEKVNDFVEESPEPRGAYSIQTHCISSLDGIEDLSKVTVREAKELIRRRRPNIVAFVRRGPGWYRAVFLEAVLAHACDGTTEALRDLNEDLREKAALLEDEVSLLKKKVDSKEKIEAIVPVEEPTVDGDSYLELRAENRALQGVIVNLFRETRR